MSLRSLKPHRSSFPFSFPCGIYGVHRILPSPARLIDQPQGLQEEEVLVLISPGFSSPFPIYLISSLLSVSFYLLIDFKKTSPPRKDFLTFLIPFWRSWVKLIYSGGIPPVAFHLPGLSLCKWPYFREFIHRFPSRA